MKKCFQKFTVYSTIMLFLFLQPEYTLAASLTNVSNTLTDKTPQVSTTHTTGFTIATTGLIKQINFQFETAGGNSIIPSHMNLGSATLGTMTGLTPASWTLDKTSQAAGLLKLTSTNGETKNISDAITVPFGSILNPQIGDCSGIATRMQDTCYLTIKTYSDAGVTLVDSGTISYIIQDTPALSFMIEGVLSGVINNGITTSVATNYNTLPFGVLQIAQPVYAAHKLTVSTTAANGYTVTAKLKGYLQGIIVADKIDPFAAINTTWNTPQLWTRPTGTVANTDTGWIGANTTDTRVSGWIGASQKFGPISSTAHEVMKSTVKDVGTIAYVTYAVEANQYQPYDSYAVILAYDCTAVY